MTVSSLATKTVAASASNYTSGRSGKSICKITPHHMAGVLTAEACAKLFQASSREASANYCIGYDGEIVCSVEEENRSWCSSSGSNDRQAITIECSNSSTGDDWPISDATWNALVELCVDICTRYGFTLEYTGDSSGSLTEHRMFKATACPGEYLHSRMAELAETVNARLGVESSSTTATSTSSASSSSSSTLDLGNTSWWGVKYTTALQTQRGTTIDGYLSGQLKSNATYFINVDSSTIKYGSGGSLVIRSLQNMLINAGYSCGSTGADGQYGKNSIKAHQQWLNAKGYGSLTVDGYHGPLTNAAMAKALQASAYSA